MVRIATGRIITMMENVKPLRDKTIGQKICCAVSYLVFTIEGYSTVSSRVFTSFPFPALRRGFYLNPIPKPCARTFHTEIESQ